MYTTESKVYKLLRKTKRKKKDLAWYSSFQL